VNRREFDEVVHIEAEAIGVPGQRRFRIALATDTESAFLWLEKQQLQALGLAFEQILTQLQTIQIAIPGTLEESSAPAEAAGLSEYYAARLAVGYDEQRRLITIFVHEPDTAEDDPPDFIWRMSPERSGALAMQIRRVVRAGARQHSTGHMRGMSPNE
jgi:hypothetical protein